MVHLFTFVGKWRGKKRKKKDRKPVYSFENWKIGGRSTSSSNRSHLI
ncbi:hypothetical protein [Brevibacillus dissolubilis]|nr:hypothetical protein [Brevibacillus dissolubilis]